MHVFNGTAGVHLIISEALTCGALCSSPKRLLLKRLTVQPFEQYQGRKFDERYDRDSSFRLE